MVSGSHRTLRIQPRASHVESAQTARSVNIGTAPRHWTPWPVKFKFLGVAEWRLNTAATWMAGRLREVGAGRIPDLVLGCLSPVVIRVQH